MAIFNERKTARMAVFFLGQTKDGRMLRGIQITDPARAVGFDEDVATGLEKRFHDQQKIDYIFTAL